MEREKVVEYAKKCMPVKYDGAMYCLTGYKVEYDRDGQHLSVCLIDNMRRKIWVDYKDVIL